MYTLANKKIAGIDLEKISAKLCTDRKVVFVWDKELEFSSKTIDTVYEGLAPAKAYYNHNYFSYIYITDKFLSDEKICFINAHADFIEIQKHLKHHIKTQSAVNRAYYEKLKTLATELKKEPRPLKPEIKNEAGAVDKEMIHEKIDTTNLLFLATALKQMEATGLGKGTVIKIKFFGGDRNSTLTELKKNFYRYIKDIHPDTSKEENSSEIAPFLLNLWNELAQDPSLKK